MQGCDPATDTERLREALRAFPAVALLGPRQVGKTTLATLLADEEGDRALYLDLELPSDRANLADPELYFASHEDKLVILDEIHRTPGIFQILRGVIDLRRREGNQGRRIPCPRPGLDGPVTAVCRNAGWPHCLS